PDSPEPRRGAVPDSIEADRERARTPDSPYVSERLQDRVHGAQLRCAPGAGRRLGYRDAVRSFHTDDSGSGVEPADHSQQQTRAARPRADRVSLVIVYEPSRDRHTDAFGNQRAAGATAAGPATVSGSAGGRTPEAAEPPEPRSA